MAEADEIKNSLELDDSTSKEGEKPVIDVDGLLSQLESAGIENEEQLQNKLTASSQAGTAFRKLGESNKSLEIANQRIQNLENQLSNGPAPKQSSDWDSIPEDGTEVDIQKLVRNAVKGELVAHENEKNEKLYRAQDWVNNQRETIHGDEDYALVKDLWEAKESDPKFAHGVNTGRLVPVDEYNKLLRGFYKGIVKKSHETITALSGKKPITPILESEQSPKPNILSDQGGEDDTINKAKAKVGKGKDLSTAEQLAALDATLGNI